MPREEHEGRCLSMSFLRKPGKSFPNLLSRGLGVEQEVHMLSLISAL